MSAIEVAIKYGQLEAFEIVRLLLPHVPYDSSDIWRKPLILQAVHRRNLELVQLLIPLVMDKNPYAGKSMLTAMEMATKQGDFEMVQLITDAIQLSKPIAITTSTSEENPRKRCRKEY